MNLDEATEFCPQHDGLLLDNLEFRGKKLESAILVGVYNRGPKKQICEEHLAELEELANTYGLKTLKHIPCSIKKFDASTYIGKGKVEEIRDLAREMGAHLIIFDDEIMPSQQRNLEAYFDMPVMDRTELILGIFSQHARSKEAKLQIEWAQIKYQIPRLKRLWTHLSRQKGGGVNQKGEGEKQLELDKRMLQHKLDRLHKELKKIVQHRDTQRQARARAEVPSFAIIGYTNAGKSTLLNALTHADVLVENKLFATLDTTTRKFTLPNNQQVLMIDTVGFIRKLPHSLVAAFRSTLDEAMHTDILLHLIDVSHELAEEHAETTYEVLKQLGGEDKHIITVLNKIDLCEDSRTIDKLRIAYPHTVQISALEETGFDVLIEMMIDELKKRREEVFLKIPQSEYALVSELNKIGQVIYQDYEDNDVIIRVQIPSEFRHRIEPFISE